jgi:hypothetical protein
MLRSWRCNLRVTQRQTTLLLSGPDGDLLKARLDTQPCHPRALLTLLEGLSLWSGEPLSVALTVDGRCHGLLPSTLFGDELWPGSAYEAGASWPANKNVSIGRCSCRWMGRCS